MMTPRATIARVTGLYLGADFFRFWLATTAALFGSSFGLIVIPLLASIVLRASAAQIGLIGFLELAPYLAFGLLVGGLVDRVPRRRLMIASHVLRAAVLTVIPVTAAIGVLRVGLLYGISFAFGSLTLLFDVAHQTFLPGLVGKERLLEANGRMQFSRSSAELSGPGLAGVVVQLVTAPFALIVNAVSFVGAAVLLGTVGKEAPAREREQVAAAGSHTVIRDMRDGIALVMRDSTLRALAWSLAALYFFITAMTPLIILFTSRTLRLAPEMIGIAYAVGGAGTLVGAVINVGLIRRFGLNKVMPLAAMTAALGPLCVAVAGRSTVFPLLLLGQTMTGAGGTVFAVAQVSLRQYVTPPNLLGRMNGTMRFLSIGGRAIGTLAAGFVASTIGLRPTIACSVLGGLVAVTCILTSPIARLHDLRGAARPAEEPAAHDALTPEPAA